MLGRRSSLVFALSTPPPPALGQTSAEGREPVFRVRALWWVLVQPRWRRRRLIPLVGESGAVNKERLRGKHENGGTGRNRKFANSFGLASFLVRAFFSVTIN